MQIERDLRNIDAPLGPGHYDPVYTMTRPKPSAPKIAMPRRQHTVADIQEERHEDLLVGRRNSVTRPQTDFRAGVVKMGDNNYKRNKLLDFRRQ